MSGEFQADCMLCPIEDLMVGTHDRALSIMLAHFAALGISKCAASTAHKMADLFGSSDTIVQSIPSVVVVT